MLFWETKGGNTIALSEMGERHIRNACIYCLSKLHQALQVGNYTNATRRLLWVLAFQDELASRKLAIMPIDVKHLLQAYCERFSDDSDRIDDDLHDMPF